MPTKSRKIKWSFEADFIQGCNCDYGCPCEFQAPPTRGFCEGVGAYHITKGRYGNVKLDGLGLAFVARWPGAIHQGNGTAALLYDERAKPEQREALLQIATGQAGGMPFELIAATMSKLLPPQFAAFKWASKGRSASVKIGKLLTLSSEPIKNPVTGDTESVKIVHATGFIFKEADATSANMKASVGELNYTHTGKAGFASKIKYSN